MATKPCVVCHRAIAASFMVCNFCKAEQPVVKEPTVVREKRCTKCNRLYSARLVECPFCAQAKQPSLRPSLPVREAALEEEETRDPRAARINVAIFAVPLGLGLVWGVVRLLTMHRVGGEESTGMLVPSILIGLVVAAGVALGYVGRAYDGLGEAFSENENGRRLFAIAMAIAIVPASFTAYAVAMWINSFDTAAREQDLICLAGRKSQTADGWVLPYRCNADGKLLRGSAKHLSADPGFAEDKPFRLRVARGTLGIWLRLSDPLPPKPEL